MDLPVVFSKVTKHFNQPDKFAIHHIPLIAAQRMHTVKNVELQCLELRAHCKTDILKPYGPAMPVGVLYEVSIAACSHSGVQKPAERQ